MIWAVALLAAGVGVFFRVEQVMPRLVEFSHFAAARWFIRFCFYLMAVVLIGGGVKKIIAFGRGRTGRSDK